MFIPTDSEVAPLLHVIFIFLGAVLVVISTVASSPTHESDTGMRNSGASSHP